ncbi:MAG: BRO family protein [Clostridium sp.]|uniref:BRO family protein n=1 Tax=Clostridium sp. TaxID=1506 RepID=UPI003F38EEB1
MNNLTVFKNEVFGEIRTLEVEGKPYFVGKDVATMLGYARPNDAISQHCRGTVKHRIMDSIGRNQEMSIIPESDIYRLIIKSKLPEAEKFEAWVMEEVLPQIRKTGGYIPIEEGMSDLEILSRAVLISQKTIEQKDEIIQQKENIILQQQPKVNVYNQIANTEGLVSVGEYAKTVGIGRNKLFEILRERKILMKDNLPYQRFIDGNMFEVKVSSCNNKINTTSYITTKGINWITKGLQDNGYIELKF